MKPPPRERDLNQPSFHEDGTVSYWDGQRQRWMRREGFRIDSVALEAFTPRERRLLEAKSL